MESQHSHVDGQDQTENEQSSDVCANLEAESSINDDNQVDVFIDNVGSIEDVKKVLKVLNMQWKRKLVEDEDSIRSKANKKAKSNTNPIEKKISSCEEFGQLMTRAAESQEVMDALVSLLLNTNIYEIMFKNFFIFKQVRYWKKLPGTEGMSKKENGKLHAILLSMFDAKFLNENVCWGIKCVKQDQAVNSQSNSNVVGSKKKLYLKVDGTF